jgi:hypothetical protein
MADCSEINNITIIGTSVITYDSTPLPCTDVKTCDGLNTILDKFNSVICNVAADVALLTEDITNITEDLMILSEDVIIINNRLNICCPTTTTTTTCNDAELIINGNFNTNLDNWLFSTQVGWTWSSQHGGSAHFTGNDEYDSISQNVLTVGKTYTITLTLYKGITCTDGFIEIFTGTTTSGPIFSGGTTNISLTLTCTDNNKFAIFGNALCVDFESIFIDSVSVKEYCPNN